MFTTRSLHGIYLQACSETRSLKPAALECVSREHWVLERSLLNREPAGGIKKLFLLCCNCSSSGGGESGASICYEIQFFWGHEVKPTEGGRRWRDKYSTMNERIMCVAARVPVCAHACSCTHSKLCHQPLRYAGPAGIGSAATAYQEMSTAK